MYKPQKLHPLAYLGSVGNMIKTFWIPVAIFIFNYVGGDGFSGNRFLVYIALIVLLIMIISIAIDIVQKYKTRFGLKTGSLSTRREFLF